MSFNLIQNNIPEFNPNNLKNFNNEGYSFVTEWFNYKGFTYVAV